MMRRGYLINSDESMLLEEFYRLPRQWSWGGKAVETGEGYILGDDCTTFAASWVLEVSGVDPAAGLRGTYDTAEEANAIVARAGGLVALIGGRIEPLGWARVSDLHDGDIGIVTAASALDFCVKEIPAIRFGPLWIVMGSRGPMAKAMEWTGVAWRAR